MMESYKQKTRWRAINKKHSNHDMHIKGINQRWMEGRVS